ncbi:hypothetical protein Scep_021688 [Stephania cephalantha]|uniref:Uncharacterized protein n=1 Tax=Stephania cephalantha TaxID=152367 RepID=A0AAP0FEH1_9MAGN
MVMDPHLKMCLGKIPNVRQILQYGEHKKRQMLQMSSFARNLFATKTKTCKSQIDNIYACLEKAGIQLPINVNQSSDVGSSHRPHVQTSSHDGCSPAR